MSSERSVKDVFGPYRLCVGGGGGIRTPETLSSLTVFKTAGFNRSPTPPLVILTHLSGECAFCCCTVVARLVLDRSRGLFEPLFRG